MAEKKGNSNRNVSFRLDDPTADAFRKIAAEHFPDQDTALTALIDNWKLKQVQANFPQHKDDISNLEVYIAKIRSRFIHLVEAAVDAKEIAFEGFRAESELQRETITDLRSKLTQMQQDRDKAVQNLAEHKSRLEAAETNTQLAIAAKELSDRNIDALKLADQERQNYIDTLLKQLDTVQNQANRCAEAEEDALRLRAQLSECESQRKIDLAKAEARDVTEINSLLRQINDLQNQLHAAERRAFEAETTLKSLQHTLSTPDPQVNSSEFPVP